MYMHVAPVTIKRASDIGGSIQLQSSVQQQPPSNWANRVVLFTTSTRHNHNDGGALLKPVKSTVNTNTPLVNNA